MIFRSIEMDDFGIFYGPQKLDLESGLYVLHGENGRGKTTILNAVKWVFFGTYLNRQGKAVNPDLILNQDAKRDGVDKFGVTLTMADGGSEIRATRTCEVAGSPTTSLYVERDGKALNRTDAEHLLRTLLDQQVARFFLFDGEQLQKYEELLFEEEEGADLIKTSIEQILGLPVLENAIDDLSAVSKEIGKQITKSARRSGKTKKQGIQAEQIETEIRAAQEDLAALEAQGEEARKKIAEADAVLQKDEAAREVLRKAEAVEVEIADLRGQREVAAEDRAEALAETWRDALAGAVAVKRAELEESLAAQHEAEQQTRNATQLEASLEAGSCDLCGQGIAGGVEATLRERLRGLRGGASGNGLPKLQDSLVAIARITETGDLERAVKLDERISDRTASVATKEQELQRIRESMKGMSEEEIRTAGDSRDLAQRDLGEVEHRIAERKEAIAAKQSTLQGLQRQISEAGDSEELTVLKANEERAEQLARLCEAAKARYRDNLRSRVEADASEIFMQLTTEPSHSGLRINESYGLEILDENDEVVPGRSAGQEQIVALALIGALNRNAARRAPVMMDTPFGRLDESHRRKVLSFLADMADQVFLLVHSAEVDREDLDEIAADITAEKKLERRSAFHTELLPYAAAV